MIVPETAAADWRLAGVLARLGLIAPVAAAAAGKALALTLGPLRRSTWPDVAWRASRLTDDGFPVEFSWSSRDAAVRWTAEVAGPEVAEADRLDLSLARVEALQGIAAECPADIRRWFAALAPQYRFGCWLGGRHDALGARTKLYIEVPARLDPDAISAPITAAVGKSVRWRMVGWDPQTGQREYYGRLALDEMHQPAVIARQLGFAEPDHLTAALARLLVARSGCSRPLGSESGISVALSPAGDPVALCWFAPARLIHPQPASVFTRICDAADGMDRSILDALTNKGKAGRIGMVGAGITAQGKIWYQANCRP